MDNVTSTCLNDDFWTYDVRITISTRNPDQLRQNTSCKSTVSKPPDHPKLQVHLTDQLCTGSFDEVRI